MMVTHWRSPRGIRRTRPLSQEDHLFHGIKVRSLQVRFGACWELRCGPNNRFRIFYDVDAVAHEVRVLAVAVKDRNRLLIGEEEYDS